MPSEVVYKPIQKAQEDLTIPEDTKSKNLFDYLMKYGKRIALRVENAAGAGSILYTVPKGRILFLLTAAITADIAGNDYAKLYCATGDEVLAELSSTTAGLAVQHKVVSSNFSIPLRINAEEQLIGESNNKKALHVITGYEVNSSEIY